MQILGPGLGELRGWWALEVNLRCVIIMLQKVYASFVESVIDFKDHSL